MSDKDKPKTTAEAKQTAATETVEAKQAAATEIAEAKQVAVTEIAEAKQAAAMEIAEAKQVAEAEAAAAVKVKLMTAAEAAKHVRRTVTELVDGKDAAGKLVQVPRLREVAVQAHEVLTFRDHGTHVVVVTRDGQKFTDADE